MATAQVIFQRFYYSKSFIKYSSQVCTPTSTEGGGREGGREGGRDRNFVWGDCVCSVVVMVLDVVRVCGLLSL